VSRDRPVSAQAVRQVAGAIVVVLGVIAYIVWLRQIAPQIDLAPPIPGLAEVSALVGDPLSCDAVLPDPLIPQPGVGEPVSPVARISSATANACPRLWDGRVVGYVGEVVGHVFARDGGAWIQINDDGYALQSGPLPNHLDFDGTNSGLFVWLPSEFVALVTHPGESRWQGDVLAITALFMRNDLTEGGQLTLRAIHVTSLAPARSVPRPIHGRLAISALLAMMVAGALIMRERQLHEDR